MRRDMQAELEALMVEHGGLLPPSAVVEFAKDARTALHSAFTWDDNAAAEKYRLMQAERILRVWVTVEPRSNKLTRVAVSLESDRVHPGGGYRVLVDVLSDDDQRQEFLLQALKELNRLQAKYQSLVELSEVFAAVEVTKRKVRSNGRKKRPALAAV